MPKYQKAELIEGIVYIASPLKSYAHGQPHFQINTWLGVYAAATSGVNGADQKNVERGLPL